MSDKIGESNIVAKFQDHFARRMIIRNGVEASYSFANLQGIADDKFADCFISTSARCVLIEFKELESESAAEKKKPLRDDLCTLLSSSQHSDNEERSSKGHFIVWDDLGSGTKNIHSYPRKVCPLFEINYEFNGESYDDRDFITGIIDERVGLNIAEMNEYVKLMSAIANQSEQSACPEFKAFLFTFDIAADDFRENRFDDLCQLQELMKVAMKRISAPKLR